VRINIGDTQKDFAILARALISKLGVSFKNLAAVDIRFAKGV
jgi:hypothetical protein